MCGCSGVKLSDEDRMIKLFLLFFRPVKIVAEYSEQNASAHHLKDDGSDTGMKVIVIT